MSSIKTCAVSLTGNKEVYRKGECVSGRLTLDVIENLVVKGVRVYLYGESLAKWDDFTPFKDTESFIAKEKYFGRVFTVFGKKVNESGPNVTLTAERHTYNFKFTLPSDGLPASYEGEYGGIRYWIKIEIAKPLFKFNQSWYRGITILDDINVNDDEYKERVTRQATKQISRTLGLGDCGRLTLTAAIDRSAYCPGEKIAVTAVVNNESTKDLGKLKAEVVQKVAFTAINETKIKETVLRVLEGTPIRKGEERNWKDQLLEVDAVPQTTKERTCHIISVSYFVKVLVEVPFGFNLQTIMPITIGTIPFGYNPRTRRSTAGATANALETDASSAITYTKCNRGFVTCRMSEDNFPNYGYIPMCAYVPNYTFPPPQRALQAATANRTAQMQQAASSRPASPQAASPRPAAPQAAGLRPAVQQATGLRAAAPEAAAPRPATPQAAAPRAIAAQAAAPRPAAPQAVVATEKVPETLPRPLVLVPPSSSHVVPSAPFAEHTGLALPPLHDEVLRMTNPQAISEIAVEVEKADKPYGILMVRFPDALIHEFRTSMEGEVKSLKESEGEIIALAPQVLNEPEPWRERTSVAILKFPSVEAATSWFIDKPGVKNSKWLESCDAIVGTMNEQYKEGNRTFSVTQSKLRPGTPKSKVKTFSDLIKVTSKPLRIMKSGISLVAGKPSSLQGQWMDEGFSISVLQWVSVRKYYEYKFAMEDEKYKDFRALLKECFEYHKPGLFQSEDLTPFQAASVQAVAEAGSLESIDQPEDLRTEGEEEDASGSTEDEEEEHQETTPKVYIKTEGGSSSSGGSPAEKEKAKQETFTDDVKARKEEDVRNLMDKSPQTDTEPVTEQQEASNAVADAESAGSQKPEAKSNPDQLDELAILREKLALTQQLLAATQQLQQQSGGPMRATTKEQSGADPFPVQEQNLDEEKETKETESPESRRNNSAKRKSSRSQQEPQSAK